MTCRILLCHFAGSRIAEWLEMEVIQTTEWLGHDVDIVFCTEPSFEYLKDIRARRPPNAKVPIIIFVAMDAIEASALCNDARILSKESVVEIITQP